MGVTVRQLPLSTGGLNEGLGWCMRHTIFLVRQTKPTDVSAPPERQLSLLAMERHLRLNLSDNNWVKKVCLLDSSLAASGFYCDAINVKRFQEVCRQAVVFKCCLPRHWQTSGAAGWEPLCWLPNIHQTLVSRGRFP